VRRWGKETSSRTEPGHDRQCNRAGHGHKNKPVVQGKALHLDANVRSQCAHYQGKQHRPQVDGLRRVLKPRTWFRLVVPGVEPRLEALARRVGRRNAAKGKMGCYDVHRAEDSAVVRPSSDADRESRFKTTVVTARNDGIRKTIRTGKSGEEDGCAWGKNGVQRSGSSN
jgi:hypothetical protein